MKRIPSTQALRALDAFARLGTVWQAADELRLTRSAVSHQLRLLEQDLGFPLTSRKGTRLDLTPQGLAYAADVGRALAALAGSASRNASRGIGGELTVSCTPGFATAWLCPRLGSFARAFPDISLSLTTPRRLDDVSNPEADLFIAFGTGLAPGMEGALLREVAFTPLCSPVLLNRLDLDRPEALASATLLHLGDRGDWANWFRHAGLALAPGQAGLVFSDMNLVYAAALAAQGVAMGDEFISAEALATGQLVRPFDLSIPAGRGYYLALPPDRAEKPAVLAFRNWLAGELPPAPA